MNRTQRILYRLMEDFDKICHDNGLEYFIGGGTALGALRNSGFLAWDDDVDLFVTYETHLKLNEVMQKIDMPDRKWVAEEITPYFWNPIARFFDLTTTDIVKDKINDGTPNGHCLEIFTLDPYPNTEEEQKKYHKYLWLYTEINNPRFLSANLSMPEEMIDKDLYHYYRDMMEREGREAAITDIFKHMTYPEDECDFYCARWSYRPLIFRKEWVQNKEPIRFEGRTFPAATGIIRQMISNYNSDWNIVPTKKERQTHPSLENTQLSYIEHDQEVRDLCDAADFNALLHENTDDRVERVFSQFDLQKEVLKLRTAYMDALVSKLGESSWTYDDSKRDLIGEALDEYLKLCFTKSYKKFRHSSPMHDDLRETIFYYLIYSNRRDDALYFTELYRNSDKYKDFSRINFCLSEMKIARYEKDIDLAEVYVNELINKWNLGEQLEVERTKVWLFLQKKKDFTLDDIQDLKLELKNPDDREICKYYGDIAFLCGDLQIAKEYYRDAYPSRNGVLITEMQKRGFFDGEKLSNESIRYLELLKEFDSICKSIGIDYIAGNSLAKIEEKKRFYNIKELQVFVKPKSMVDLLEYFEENRLANREIEYYGNNPNYPTFSMRYIDTSTTSLDASVPTRYKMDGMCIEIIPLRGFRPSKINIYFIIEKAQLLKDRYTRAYVSSTYKGLKRIIINRFSNYLNSKNNEGRHKVFLRMCDYYDKHTDTFWVLNNRDHFKQLPAEYLKKAHRFSIFEEYTARVPDDLSEYLRILKRFNITIGYRADSILDCDVSYTEFISRIKDPKAIKSIAQDIITEYDKLGIALVERDNDIDKAWEEIVEAIKTEE